MGAFQPENAFKTLSASLFRASVSRWPYTSTVTAIGDDLTVSLNGVPVVTLPDDAKGRKKGRIALQLHGGMDMHVEFRNLFVLPLGGEE